MHRVLYEFGSGAIYAYGTMMQIGVLAVFIFIYLEARKEGFRVGPFWILFLILLLIPHLVLFPARLVYYFLHLSEFQPMEISPGVVVPGVPWWDLSRGGLSLSIHGAFLGAVITLYVYSLLAKVNFWKLLDLSFVAVPLGLFFGRIGCYMNGCCYGIAFANRPNAPWFAIRYPTIPVPESLRYPPYPLDGLLRHPAPLYMAFGALILFFYLWYFKRQKARFPGHTFLMFLFLYSVLRFLQEMSRFDASSRVIGEWFTLAQIVSIIIGGVALFFILERMRHIRAAQLLPTVPAEEGLPAEQNEPLRELPPGDSVD